MRLRSIAKSSINAILRPLGVELRPLLTEADRRMERNKQLSGRIVKKYLDSCDPKILQIAAGADSHAECYRNWLNSDICTQVCCEDGFYCIHLDLNEGFPLPDKSFDYVFSQQGIEHFTYQQGAGILLECFRVLKPGGRIRIETPDLLYFIDRYLHNDRPVPPAVHQFAQELEAPPTHLSSMNSIFLQFGHRYVYDVVTLAELCRRCGFTNVRQVDMGKSDIVPFRAAIAFNPGENTDSYYLECSFALEMERA